MVFSSNLFLFYFLPAVLVLYYATPRPLRFLVLTLASYVFYAWSDPRFVLLLLWVTAVDFVIGNLIGGHWSVFPVAATPDFGELSRTASPLPDLQNMDEGSQLHRTPPRWFQRILLILSLTNSLGLLFYFKYAMFAQELANHWRSAFGAGAVPVLSIVLPAGISFYTFESISYVVDIYRDIARPASERFLAAVPATRRGPSQIILAELRSLTAFACYLAQFPHLVAGPIIRYQELEPQLHQPQTNLDNFTRGIFFLCLGLAKKVLIANTVARAADLAFTDSALNCLDAWWGTFAYAFQIYFDFSGYTDMAIGLALMLGFQFPRNFNAPYKSTSITDFWRRWHITLSTWLRDYLYIPLGGNRRARWRTYLNLLITMFLGGLWHGAALNFAAWGLYHGAWLSIERVRSRRGIGAVLPRPFQIAITFVIVCIGWVLFRSDGLSSAGIHLAQLLPVGHRTSPVTHAALYDPDILVMMLTAGVLSFLGIQTWDLAGRLTLLKLIFALLLFCVSVIVLAISASSPFLYFRF